jgi:hypothetical protein
MPTGQAVITAKTGPNVQNTAIALANVVEVRYAVARNVLFVEQSNPAQTKEYDLGGVTTATIVISGGNFTFTVS